MNIVLANLRGVKEEPNGTIRHFVKAGSRWPMTIGSTRSVDYYPFPFYLAYSSALLKSNLSKEHCVKAIDGVVNDLDEKQLFESIKQSKPDILIAELTLIDITSDLQFLENVKNELRCMIIVVGVYPTIFKEEALANNAFIDFAIFGEYELSLNKLILSVVNKTNQNEQIEGLVFRVGDFIIAHKLKASVENMDDLPFPDRNDFPASRYSDFAMHYPSVSLMATRGCPAGCIYCVERQLIYDSPKYRMRDVRSVVDEMELCKKNFKIKQFYFDDQSFVVNKKYVKSLCEEMISRKINIPWTCMGDAMFLDFETLSVMKTAGCIGMKFGVESANEEILKNIGKPLKLAKALEVALWCRKLKIISHATFCIGLPGETEQTIKNTIDFIKKINCDSAQVSRAVPYPGTPFYSWAKEHGYLIVDRLEDLDGANNSVLSLPELSNEQIDLWYEKISKLTSRMKLINYLKHPLASMEIIFSLIGQKGIRNTFSSLTTFVKRAFKNG